MIKKSTRLKEIALELNLSVNTVSRALRDCDDISTATKEIVRKKAYEMGYLPNSISQLIKRDDKKLIALTINNFNNLYFSVMCAKFSKIISENNYDFTLLHTFSPTLDEDTIKQAISERVDAIICFFEPTKEALKLANYNNIKLVFLCQYPGKEHLNYISIDNEAGGKLAANYLLKVQKCKKFIYIGLKDFIDSKNRYKAFKESIMNSSPDNEVIFIDSLKEGAYDILSYIFDGYNGIFCFNDETAYHLLHALNQKIPNFRRHYPDLHIVGFDCLSQRIDGIVDLTSIDFDYDGICRKSLQIIEDEMNAITTDAQKIIMPVTLHQRINKD